VTTLASKKSVPQAKEYLNNMKFEIANELGVNLKQGYNGDLTARQNGSVGGQMVKRMIQEAKNK
jgi:hypothetical protein